MSPQPRPAAKGKAPAAAAAAAADAGGPAAMDVDARRGPASTSTAPDEVVAEYELVLCEPAGGASTEVSRSTRTWDRNEKKTRTA